MSEKKSKSGLTKDELILKAMKMTLTDIIKDTTVKPGVRHPLSEDTIDSIRKCLFLISEREQELAEAAGRPNRERPRYVDEPRKSAVVSLDSIKKQDTPSED